MGEVNKVSSGVQDLIARIRDEGVQAGRNEADSLVQEAQKRAAEIVEQARAEADTMLTQAREVIAREEKAAREALQLAVRETVLEFRANVTQRFSNAVKGLVAKELTDTDFLRQMILAIAARSVPDEAQNRALELLLSAELFPADDDGQQSMRDFIMGLTSQIVQEGIELKPAGHNRPGILLRLVGEDLQVELTEEALSAMLLSHLLPRFRAYVQQDH